LTQTETSFVHHDSSGMPVLLTVGDLAKRFRCDPETVKRQARCGKLPGFKFGKTWFFRPSDIEGMIDAAIGAAHREDE
jgi:hypothetical protein